MAAGRAREMCRCRCVWCRGGCPDSHGLRGRGRFQKNKNTCMAAGRAPEIDMVISFNQPGISECVRFCVRKDRDSDCVRVRVFGVQAPDIAGTPSTRTRRSYTQTVTANLGGSNPKDHAYDTAQGTQTGPGTRTRIRTHPHNQIPVTSTSRIAGLTGQIEKHVQRVCTYLRRGGNAFMVGRVIGTLLATPHQHEAVTEEETRPPPRLVLPNLIILVIVDRKPPHSQSAVASLRTRIMASPACNRCGGARLLVCWWGNPR